MTTRGRAGTIVPTAEYVVIPAPFPCSVALFSCPCGAEAFDDTKHVPKGWSTADDGSCRCPECTEKAVGRAG